MVYRFVENQQKASVNFDGEFSGEVDKNTNKRETEVSLIKVIIFKQKFTKVYLYKRFNMFVKKYR